MSLSPVALEALRAAQSAFNAVEADVFEDALARGLEAVDREGRLVGAASASELERLRAFEETVAKFVAARAEYVSNLRNCSPDNGHDYDRWQGHAAARRQLAELLGLPVAWPSEDAVSEKPADGLTRTFVPVQALRVDHSSWEDPHDGPLARKWSTPHDLELPEPGEVAAPEACEACGSAPDSWCPDCAACQNGCYDGFVDNPCTHANASWGGGA
jgi:hypothetical protein